MQFSRALRALPVVFWLGPSAPDASLAAQARYRITTDGAWFFQEAGGKRLARLARGAQVAGGDAQGDWLAVTLEGWIFATSVGPAPRPGVGQPDTSPAAPDPSHVESARRTVLYRAPEGAPTGTLAPSAPLRVLGRSGDWTRVEIDGWVRSGDLQAAPAGVLVGVSAAELRAEPQRYVGQVRRWTLQVMAVQEAAAVRPDIPNGATYLPA